MFGTPQRIELSDSPLTKDMYSSLETEKELERVLKKLRKKTEIMNLMNQTKLMKLMTEITKTWFGV